MRTEARKQKREKKRSIWMILLCNIFLSFSAAFFLPLSEVLRNQNVFVFPFAPLWAPLLIISIGITILLSLLMAILPVKAGRIAASVSFGIGLAVFVQDVFFSDGKGFFDKIDMYGNWPGRVLNCFIWFGIIIITVTMFIACSKERSKQTRIITSITAGALTIVHLVLFLILLGSTDTSIRKTNHYLSADGKFTLSAENNTVVFVFDTADENYFLKILEKYPDLSVRLSGWEYYTNVNSVYSRSYPAITYMLTGEKCWFDKKPEQYISEAFSKSRFLRQIYNEGTDVRVYTKNPEMVGSSSADCIVNSSIHEYTKNNKLIPRSLLKNLTQISLFRAAPFLLKTNFAYNPDDINQSSYEEIPQPGPAFANYIEPDFYTALLGERINVTDQYSKAFRFYHLWGTQPGYFWNQDLAGVGECPPEDALRGSIMLVEVYAYYMRELGIYDDATIIITTGNGSSGGNSGTLDVPAAACPVLLAKYPHSDASQPLIMHTSPVSQEDLFATIEKSLDVSVSGTGSGRTLRDIREDEERTRYYYYSSLFTDDDGEIALREYEINGDANDLANWRATGKWWDIHYSMNRVSANRYSGE